MMVVVVVERWRFLKHEVNRLPKSQHVRRQRRFCLNICSISSHKFQEPCFDYTKDGDSKDGLGRG